MKILVYGINYYPELTGSGKYTSEACTGWVEMGHEVEVITTHPYYPAWRVSDDYRGKGWFTEQIAGVTVRRCPAFVPQKVTAVSRIALEVSFVFSSLVYWIPLLFKKKPDVLLVVSPPFQLGFMGFLFHLLTNTAWVYHIQDLQVDIVHDLGMIRNRRLLRFLFACEKFLLTKATWVSTISAGMQAKIVSKGIPSDKVLLFPNWVDTEKIFPSEVHLRVELGYQPHDFIVQYSGTIAEKQGLDQLIPVAQALPRVQFMIVGEGGYKATLQAMVEAAGLSNIRFFPLQPYARLSASLATADLHLVLQKRAASDLVLPSKLTSILAAGGCALVTAEPGTSLYTQIHEAQMGILIEPESVEALIRGIQRAQVDDVSGYQTRARQYAQQYLDKGPILAHILKVLDPSQTNVLTSQEFA